MLIACNENQTLLPPVKVVKSALLRLLPSLHTRAGAFKESATNMKLTEQQIQKFWSMVDKNGPEHPYDKNLGRCWIWTHTIVGGYGDFYCNSKHIRTHRIAYELSHGEIPHDGSPHGICACHSCDNRACVNPQHIFLGTNLDNVRDKQLKGRAISVGVKGEKHWNANLTEEKVKEIRNKYVKGVSKIKKLAVEYGVNATSIYNIVERITWKHI